jgi:DNA-binding NtrC family response regulator
MKKKTILIIDDDIAICEELCEILASEGYQVEKTYSGKETKKKLDSINPDIVLLDLKLPDGSGLDLVELIHEANKDAKIIVVTAHGSLETAVESIQKELFDYINKPVNPDFLLETIKRACRTQDLEQDINEHMGELERFEKLAVGREEKIWDCKEEIKSLKKQVEELKKQISI